MQVDSERCYGTAKNGAKMRVLLSGRESQICDLLRSVSDFLVNERPDLPRIEPRIAGGWVRDKVVPCRPEWSCFARRPDLCFQAAR